MNIRKFGLRASIAARHSDRIMTQRKLTIRAESWPLRQRFSIARGSKISADVLCVEIAQDGHIGRGEAVPYKRYGESMETVTAAVESIQAALENGMTRDALLDALREDIAKRGTVGNATRVDHQNGARLDGVDRDTLRILPIGENIRCRHMFPHRYEP